LAASSSPDKEYMELKKMISDMEHQIDVLKKEKMGLEEENAELKRKLQQAMEYIRELEARLSAKIPEPVQVPMPMPLPVVESAPKREPSPKVSPKVTSPMKGSYSPFKVISLKEII
jgi:hypothetical protein